MESIKIRTASEHDAESLLEIYAPYVEKTAVTFECTVPSVSEFKRRIASVLEKYPYLVAERSGEIVGYAYANAFHERAAYAWAVETTVYVRENKRGAGIGRLLYETLEKILAEQNILNLNACIAYSEVEDEHLTNASTEFHKRMGYSVVGEFHKCGYKFGRWYNMIWMEKHIGAHTDNPPPVKRFGEIRKFIEL